MERLLKNFWVLTLTVCFISFPAQASKSNDFWESIVKRISGNKKKLVITSSREALPSVKIYPKLIGFKGVVEVPSYIYLSSGRGLINAVAAQIIYDGQIICNYSPLVNNSVYYSLKTCSDGAQSRDQMNVQSKIEVRLNYASTEKAVVSASFKVIRQDTTQYGLIFPYLTPTEGQVLSYNGEAWVPVDIEELLPEQSAGAVGPQGPAGPQGPQGLPGFDGSNGTVGAKGDKGDKGDQGDKGDAGVAGTNGAAGAPGSQGPTGTPGLNGLKGDKGDKGDAGIAGPTGTPGLNGLDGAAGAVGPQGAQGPQGPAGAQGVKGDKGDAGVAGAAGAQGDTGPMGPAGENGANGLAGAQGPMGPRGNDGADGSQGSQGLQGPIGATGMTGAQGLPGIAGADGAQGPAGAQGVKGDKGDRGLSEIAYLRDEKISGTPGGTCAAASQWMPRTLNFLGGDTSFISLSANRFVLQPGRYFIEVQAPGYAVNAHQAKLKVIESGSDVLIGSSAFSLSTAATVSHSFINGEVVVNTASTFEIQHRCQSDKANTGFGFAANFGTTEIYTQVKIIKKQ